MSIWKLSGPERRELFCRFVQLQMDHVNQQVEDYLSVVHTDICIDDIVDDMPDILVDAFRERPDDVEVLRIMQDAYTKLKEKTNEPRTDNTERIKVEE